MSSAVALVLPPGWTLHPGGPHIALPMLASSLARRGIRAEVFDANLESAAWHGAGISHADVSSACVAPTLRSMNRVYFEAEDCLQAVAGEYGGSWKAHYGFQFDGCDLGLPESVREWSSRPSPFTAYFTRSLVPRLLAMTPRVIGMNIVVAAQLVPAFELIRHLREEGYRGFVVMGGNIMTRIGRDMRVPWVFDLLDGIVVLPGERTVADLCQCLATRGDLGRVPNLTWRRDDHVLVSNQTATLTPDDFVMPDYGSYDAAAYWGTSYLPMVGSRGCFYGKCTFCAIPYGYGARGFVGTSAVDDLLAAMRYCRDRYGMNRFKFVDEAMHPRLVSELAAGRRRDDTFEFEAYVRMDRVWTEPQFLETCRAAGLRKAYVGLEILPGESRGLLDKADSANPSVMLRRFRDANIKVHLFCMFGFPGTGITEAVETLGFALEHRDEIDTLDVFPFYYARHTSVEGIERVDADRRWAIEYDYVPAAPGVLAMDEVTLLSERLRQIAWRTKPEWLHPVYRMHSPWCVPAAESVASVSSEIVDASPLSFPHAVRSDPRRARLPATSRP